MADAAPNDLDGEVEHDIHERVASLLPGKASTREPNDPNHPNHHRPFSVTVTATA